MLNRVFFRNAENKIKELPKNFKRILNFIMFYNVFFKLKSNYVQ